MKRRLSAIVSTDIVGYSRLMGADEAGTLARMKAHRQELWAPSIEKHGGRIVGTAGDSLLIEFDSAVSAVRMAVDIQSGMAARESETPESEKMQLRIGVNIGEVVVDDDDIFGDGVNVAARMQEIADAGSICISSKVFEEIEGKIDASFVDAGQVTVKNIVRPVHVWRWRRDTMDFPIQSGPAAFPAASTADAAADKPTIAVLPFDNMSGDPDQEFFADGMTEDLITDLSRLPWFYVVARNSTFVFKGKAVDVKQVAEHLGVRYVLEGSVRKAGNRIRINAQLIDAATGNHVWADRFDREIEDIFAIQDEVTQAIVGAVTPEFLTVEAKRAQRKEAGQLDAWECMIRGRALIHKMGREEVAQARALFHRAIELVPDGRFGAADLAVAYWFEYYYRWTDDPDDDLRKMARYGELAVAADPEDPWALTALAFVRCIMNQWDETMPLIERALQRNPAFAPAVALKGFFLALNGDVAEAAAQFGRARALSPYDPFTSFWLMGLFWAHYMVGDYEKAAATARDGLRLAPQNPTYRRQLAAALAMMGRDDEAHDAITEYLRLEPTHTMADAAKVPTRSKEHLHLFLEGLRKAGLPE